eukprot:3926960-Prymnesium_polylepis.2
MLAFAHPIVTGRERPTAERTAASAPTSVGSPRASIAEESADASSTRCADPLGAVKLAERPSCRTVLLRIVTGPLPVTCGFRTAALTLSDRTYPLARASNVLHRPLTDSIPADAAPSVPCSARTRLTASAKAWLHSAARTADVQPCVATSAEEHAVSMLILGPCNPRAKEMRPEATDTLSPNIANAESRTDGGWASNQSGRSIPRKIPASLPSSVLRRPEVLCSAVYPISSRSRCCGSIARASARAMPKACASNTCAPDTNPPLFAQCSKVSESNVTSTTASRVHRNAGTSATASPEAA